jgi:hypothetical protein
MAIPRDRVCWHCERDHALNVRIRLETRAARSMLVGPFDTLAGARQLADDLIADGSVGSVIVQQQDDDGAWREMR